MKDLIISYNEHNGFYCEDFSDKLYFHKVLLKLVDKYDLNIHDFGRDVIVSDIEMYLTIKDLNKKLFNIELRDEDGGDWIF